ncbi:MAG: head-tail adaptor protein [Hyphomonadaceae bacterium]|nr:head-tail adaptor protein [Hyphomonadaceae bacterium]
MSARLGQLRHRIQLERPGALSDLTGGEPPYVAAGGAWAAVVAVAAEDVRTRYTLVMRRRRDIRPGWRIMLGDRRLRVTAVSESHAGARLLVTGEHDQT